MSKDFESLMKLAKNRSAKSLAVAGAEDRNVLLSIKMALNENIIEPILVGDEKEIRRIAKEIDLKLENIEIIHETDKIKSSSLATKLVSSGKASILMKGLVDTAIIMKQVLNKDIGLKKDKLISHISIFHMDSYHKMFFVTDGAMNIAPNLEDKKEIINNALIFLRKLDIIDPKIAVLAAKEKVSDKMPVTLEAEKLTEMNKNGEIRGCIIHGPLALDNAISKEAAKIKGIDSQVAGDADLLLVPDIEAGNILNKSLSFLGGASTAGIILGAKAPIILTSRADDEKTKLNSIVLANLMIE